MDLANALIKIIDLYATNEIKTNIKLLVIPIFKYMFFYKLLHITINFHFLF